MAKTITVEINFDGKVAIETTGFKGDACVKATAAIESALGVTASRKKKAEFYQNEIKAGQYVGGNNPYPKGRW